MDKASFVDSVRAEPQLQGPFLAAQAELEPATRGPGVELISLGLLYPVALYLLKHIGLPWLNAAVQISNGELAKFHMWLAEKYKPYGFDPLRMEKAADAMYKELCSIKAPMDQKIWEAFRNKILEEPNANETAVR